MNINTELFRRTAPAKKLDIINNLTQNELLNITEENMLRIVKEAGLGKPHSRDKKFYLNEEVGNNWNSTIKGIVLFKRKLYLNVYVQYENTDTTKVVPYNDFFNRGKYRGTVKYQDRYGNQQTSYFIYDESDKSRVIRNICIEYIYNIYASKFEK